jgi:fermentation-respiration switch protein FrsA (DUF1100 family)
MRRTISLPFAVDLGRSLRPLRASRGDPTILLSARDRYPLFDFDWLIKDKFANIDKIDKIDMPLFVIHGARYLVTPQRFGRMLFERAREPKSALWLSDAGHNDLAQFGMIEAVMRFLDGLPPRMSKAS